jgi:hypothetical protein
MNEETRWRLSGATNLITTDQKSDLLSMVTRLMTCEEHDGRHHFAVIQEGRTLALSDIGVQCIQGRDYSVPHRADGPGVQE